jgi:hypothetical protein
MAAESAPADLLVILIPRDGARRHRIDVIELSFDHPRQEWSLDTRRLRCHGFLAGFG